jgi:hypothetical protein
MENFRSTFPLNEKAIARKALGKIMTDPITWVPLVPAVAAYTIFDVPAPFSLGFGALVLGGVGAYWRKQWDGVTDALRRKAIADHNRAQDAILKAAVDDLRLNGGAAYATKLEQFLAVKRQVEARIHEDGAMTAQKIQIEQLIDALCFGVRDQLAALATKERNRESVDRKAALAQVDTAFETLQSTAAELDTILGPGAPPANATDASIEEITKRLREEGEIARRVQARLRAEEDSPASSEPPRMESQ